MTKSDDKKVPALRFKGFTDDWEQHKLGNMANILRGASPRPIKDKKWFDTNSRIGWIRISDVTSQNGRVYTLGQHLSKKGQEKTHVVSSQTLLLSIAASVGYPVITYVETGVHDGFIIFDKPKFNLDFMFFKLQSIQNIWSKYGQPGSQVNINSSIVANTSISIPNIKEQKKISILLKKIEENIHLQQRKLEQLNLLQRALLQRIFANRNLQPDLRFTNFSGAWEQRKFESLIYPEKIKNKNNLQLPAYSISNKNGFIAQTDQFGKDNTYSKTDKKTNYIVNPGAFAYNPARINVGSIGYQNLATPVLVSSLYEVFKTNSQINDLFLIYWFKTDKFFNQIKKYEEGGVRQYYFLDKLLFSEIIIPKDAREQQKISKILKKLDYLFSLQQNKINKLQELKRSFLQNMFI
ncbi:restriction endonuclease subunit S [Lactobacillus johnsonii]|uniref:restriction endonuclease subunit S n=1 Tax=Lactobacillus johnsonii TaxID=33959 RepID=UPI002B261E3A|nr:restriction endonuclease subunit S [Lactobacillus johnsonii]WPE30231.1 restriction endonuclease subunit S [Lactobacillus johnsonii]